MPFMNTDDIEILKYDISVYHNITIFTVLCEQRLIEPFVVVVKMIASMQGTYKNEEL